MKKVLLAAIICSITVTIWGCGIEKQKVGEMSEYNTQISGSFTATVQDIIPDYVLDDKTPLVGVVTLFQDTPFTVYLGEELASQVEIGETYVFSVESVTVEEPVNKIGNMSIPAIIYSYGMRITETRPAESNEIGLESLELIVEEK